MISRIREIAGKSIRGRTPWLRRAFLLAVVPVVWGCNTGELVPQPPTSVAATNINSSFVADQSPDCPRADLLSIQPASTAGSLIAVNIVLTDCDGSLPSSGLGFEVSFDSSVISFLSCSAGSFFPKNQLAPQTPECVLSNGRVLGTIGLTPPSSVTMGGNGHKDIVQLAFNVIKKGVGTPIAFQSIDQDNGTALWLIDNTPTVTFHVLGASGYAGGTFIGN